MRSHPSIVHVDLDAFFASVEQRDKPSLRGRPVVVGGTGMRGVVSTASYEARTYGARSAMSTAEARAICPPGTAFLAPRFEAYVASSRVVMDLLRELSPAVEQVSIDEAYVDLTASDGLELTVPAIEKRLGELQEQVVEATGGLTLSAGAASSKMLAKIGSELRKPGGVSVIAPGTEEDVLTPMPVRAIAGVGPATSSRLRTFGVETVGDLRRMSEVDLVSVFGEKHGRSLYALARAQDDRELTLTREAKSISAEETFEVDVRDRRFLERELTKIAERVAERMSAKGVFARTVHLKVRHPDFSLASRSLTSLSATGEADVLARQAHRLLAGLDVSGGVRLIGMGASGFVPHSQDGLFDVTLDAPPAGAALPEIPEVVGTHPIPDDAGPEFVNPSSTRFTPSASPSWRTGQDVTHTEYGSGWVWGAGRGRVTVRFEGPRTPPGPIRTFPADDPDLSPAQPPSWRSD